MASLWCLIVVVVITFHQLPTTNAGVDGKRFNSMYQFGDSLADTGNLRNMFPNITACSTYPYGKTYFGYPNGRCSDGLLMCDFFAKAFGLPFLNPYLNTSANFSNGVNFAMVGATALDFDTLQTKNITSLPNASLPIELGWFKTYLQSISSSSQERRALLRRSLFFMGEIGGNDINFVFAQGKTIQLAYSLVPDVAQAIKNATQEIINEGARYIVVPGNFPIGCLPVYLENSGSNDTSMYDELKCLKTFNRLARFENHKIKQVVKELRKQYSGVIIKYADYYNAYLRLIKNAASLGFEEDQVFSACCGSQSIQCGTEGAPLCENPKTRISWDGLHPTHQANKYMADWIISRIFVN